MTSSQRRIEQIAQITAIVILVLGCFLVLRPFMTALLWAAVLCFATWPAYRRVEGAVKGRRTVAALLMTALLVALLVVPLIVIGASLADNVTALIREIRSVLDQGLHQAPPWLGKLPLAGPSLESYWNGLAESRDKLAGFLTTVLVAAKDSLLKGGLSVGQGILQLSLSAFIAFFFYRDGQALVEVLRAGINRIAGSRTQRLMETVGATVKGVVFGILGTALAQGLLAFGGFWIAGVPGAALLGIVTFIFSLVPMGPPLVWIPVTAWLFYQGQIGWGVFMAIWGFLVVSGVDNVIKPYLISREAKLPFVLVFLGVLGGLIAFGVVGIFLGPTLLAVGFGLVREWATGREPDPLEP